MTSQPQTGPGAELKAARESMEVSVREVADALNLPIRVIEALEADDYEGLQPTVFTRGYLRSYARLLELPPDGLLAAYPEVTTEIEVVQADDPAGRAAPGRTQLLAVIGGAGLLLVIGLLIWLFSGDEPVSTETPAEPAAAAEPADEPAVPPAVEPEDQREAAESSTDVEIPDVTPGESRSELPEPVILAEQPGQAQQQEAAELASAEGSDPARAAPPAATVTAETPAPESVVRAAPETTVSVPSTAGHREQRLTEFGEQRLFFTFSSDCWVEVKAASGENLYSDLNRAGWTLTLTGQGPFRILLGFAPGVSLAFNDEPVNLAPHTRNNVANLVLGQ